MVIVLLVASSMVFAQKASQQSWEYHAYREEMSVPTYGLAKVKALIKKVKAQGNFKYTAPKKDFDALTLQEKFTYTMLHGEQWMQICAGSFAVANEEKKLFSQIPNRFPGDELWTENQVSFLRKNRAEIIPLIRATMLHKMRAGMNIKQAIIETNATELTPELIQIYNVGKKDNDILTTLMLLMRQGKYQPFIASNLYKTLYSKDKSYYEGVDVNADRVKFVLRTAQSFYQAKHPVSPKKTS